MVGLILVLEILALLVVVGVAHQVLEWLCLQLRRVMEAMEVRPLCITEPTTEVEVAGLRVLPVRMVRPTKDEEEVQHLLQAAATGLLVQPQRRHRSAWRIRAAVEVVVRILWVDSQEQRVVRAL